MFSIMPKKLATFVGDLLAVAVDVVFRAVERAVGGVGRDVGEEGLVARADLSIQWMRLVEEDVGAVALGLLEGAVVEDGGVEVGVVGGVAAGAGVGLADAARAVDEDLVEAAVLGLIGGLVAEVPLAEDAGGVAGGLEVLGERGGVEASGARARGWCG